MSVALRCAVLAAALLMLGPAATFAAEPTADDVRTMAERVDRRLAERWAEAGVTPAEVADDAVFMRRVYLDLCGVIPSVAEARSFLSDEDPDKRAQLIDRLLDGPHYPTHLANLWRRMLLPDESNDARLGDLIGFQNWLRDQFLEHKRYDNIVADLLVTRGSATGVRPTLFYTALDLAPEKLAATTSRVFLGVQIQCAQCHDHPFDSWTQDDFWGYAAFFARLQQPAGDEPGPPAMREVMDAISGDVMIPGTDAPVLPKYLGGANADLHGAGNRRRELAIWMASRDNPYLPRAAVNRVWAQMFGRGLVEPVDDLGPQNRPSHPQLFDELVEFFVLTGFDLRSLHRVLANTRAYQLASTVASTDDAPPAELFAQRAVRPMSADQLYDSLLQATGRRATGTAMNAAQGTGPLADPGRRAFLARFAAPGADSTGFEAGIPQALTLMNGDMTAALTSRSSSDLLAALDAPFFTDADRIEVLFLAALSRTPTDEERVRFTQYVTERSDNRAAALGDVLWAVVNSGEFCMIH